MQREPLPEAWDPDRRRLLEIEIEIDLDIMQNWKVSIKEIKINQVLSKASFQVKKDVVSLLDGKRKDKRLR